MEPDSCALAALAARRALHLVAACLHVPAVHAHMLEEASLLQPPSTPQIVMVSGAAHRGNAEPCVLQSSRHEQGLLAQSVTDSSMSAERFFMQLQEGVACPSDLCQESDCCSQLPSVQARLGAPLMQALQRLLAVLLSSAGGLQLLLHAPVAMGALLKALDPEADPYGAVFPSETQPARSANPHHDCRSFPCRRFLHSCKCHLDTSFVRRPFLVGLNGSNSTPFAYRGTAQHLATVLRASLTAGQAAGTLVGTAGLHSLRVLSAARSLVELLPWEPGHRAAVCALSSCSGALNRLLDLVRVSPVILAGEASSASGMPRYICMHGSMLHHPKKQSDR